MSFPTINLETEQGLLQYLQTHDRTQTIVTVKKLSGGNANYVYRGTISDPNNNTPGGHSTVVIKHSADHMATNRSMALFTDRAVFEQTVLRIVADATDNKDRKLTIETEKTKVPRIFYSDRQNSVVIQEDAGSNSTTLKAFISTLDQPPSFKLCIEIGKSLGEFIARLHNYGFVYRSEFYPEKMDNPEGLSLSRMVLYDQFPKAASKYLKDQPQSVRDVIDQASKWGGDRLMHEPETLAHGDFWPGNILVDMMEKPASATSVSGSVLAQESELKHMFVVDWEMSRYGPAAMDVGQFMAEAFSLDKYRHPCQELMRSFLEAYCETYGDRLTEKDLKNAIIHCGGHLISWTSYAGWFDKEKDHDVQEKEIVFIGVEMIQRAWVEDWEWVRKETAFGVMVDYLTL